MTWQRHDAPAARPISASFRRSKTDRCKTWIGVGGSPESVVRAARYDLPLMLAIIGGDPKRFQPYVDLYHRAFAQFGKPVREIGVHSHGYVAETDEKAREELWPDYKKHARPHRRRTRLAADDARGIRSAKPITARSMSARRKPSRAGLPRPRRRSASRAST